MRRLLVRSDLTNTSSYCIIRHTNVRIFIDVRGSIRSYSFGFECAHQELPSCPVASLANSELGQQSS